MQFFTLDTVVTMLKEKRGTRKNSEFARDIGVSPQFVSDVFSGTRGPSKEMLEVLGLERIIAYRERS